MNRTYLFRKYAGAFVTAVFLLGVSWMPSMATANPAYSFSLQPIMSPFYGGRGRYRSRSSYRRPRQRRAVSLDELESHFLDDENWMTDKKTRLWDIRINSRRPNQYSLTSRLIFANVAMFALQAFNPRVTGWGVKLSDKILNGQELYRLLSPVFLHGGIYHLFTNMYSLSNIGPMTEQLFGPYRFLSMYLVSGAAGNLLSAMQSPNPALGASGAVFGIMAGLYVFLSRNDWIMGAQGEAYSSAITQTLLINLVLGAVNPMVDNWGHLGGAIGGACVAYYFGPRLYIAKLPGEGGRVIVDKPIMRLPMSIESIPKKVNNGFARLVRRMQVWRYKSDLPAKPWQSKQDRRSDYRRRQHLPNKSIKPKLDE